MFLEPIPVESAFPNEETVPPLPAEPIIPHESFSAPPVIIDGDQEIEVEDEEEGVLVGRGEAGIMRSLEVSPMYENVFSNHHRSNVIRMKGFLGDHGKSCKTVSCGNCERS